jgi:hypothetical protein
MATYPWQNSEFFPFNESLACCCEAACPGALIIPIGVAFDPPTASPYPDETTAQAVLDDPLAVSNCIGYFEPEAGTDSVSASLTSSLVLSMGSDDAISELGDAYASLSFVTGSNVNLLFGGITGSAIFTIMDCVGQILETGTISDGIDYNWVVPPGNEFIFKFSIDAGGNTNANVSIIYDDLISVNPVKAAYGDPVQLLDCTP